MGPSEQYTRTARECEHMLECEIKDLWHVYQQIPSMIEDIVMGR